MSARRSRSRARRVGTILSAISLLVFAAASAHAEETVRIAIVERAKSIILDGEGLEVRTLSVGMGYEPVRRKHSEVRYKNGDLYLDGVRVTSPDGVRYRSTGFVTAADKPVRGQIEVRIDGDGLTAINVVPVEEYLMAVLGSEMPATFPEEALKAQAVAARTYALQRKIGAWGKPYHLSATVLSQVYGGARAEHERTRAAVRATVGEILVYRMEPIEAYFHSSCGGRTETGLAALGREMPYLPSVSCPCQEVNRSEWNLTLERADLAKLLKRADALSIAGRDGSGRVSALTLESDSERRTLAGTEFRRLMGYDKVRSLAFTLESKGPRFLLEGKGYGHGAGLCQWGAKALAERGSTYSEILSHYFPGAERRLIY